MAHVLLLFKIFLLSKSVIISHSVKDNNICKLTKDFFEKLSNLEELVISNNELTSLPLDPSKSYESMKSLNVAQNKLQSADDLVSFSNLECLDISGNDQIQVCVIFVATNSFIRKSGLEPIMLEIFRYS